MKIGILDAFPHDAPSTHEWKESPLEIYTKFLNLAKPNFEYKNYTLSKGEFPHSPDECDAYLLTGSPKGVYDKDDWLTELKNFLQTAYKAEKKLVGICFGHQMLAHSLGGHAEKSPKGWGLGQKEFDIYTEKKWMTDYKESPSLYFVHQDQVMQLPPNAELLGGNDFCPNLFYTIEDRVLGIQGHPEFSEALISEIIEERQEIIGKKLHGEALASLKKGNPDNQRFADWIVNFLLA